MADLKPKVAEVRQKFMSKYDGSILDDTYHPKDVEWVKSSDVLILNALKAFKTGGDVNKSVDLLNDMLVFRAKYKLNDMKWTDVDAELRELNGINYIGKDRKGHPILHFRVSLTKSNKVKEAKQQIAFRFNEHYRVSPDQQLVTFFDMTDASVVNMDLEISRFLASCASTYFPNILADNLMFRLGAALEAVWMIIKGFLDADLTKRTHMVTRRNVQEYIAEDQLQPHMIKTDK